MKRREETVVLTWMRDTSVRIVPDQAEQKVEWVTSHVNVCLNRQSPCWFILVLHGTFHVNVPHSFILMYIVDQEAVSHSLSLSQQG
jgi:hypothetical protein